MPVSRCDGLEDCLSCILEREPSAVLDVGSGFGLWGCLLRQYLDVEAGRVRPEQWRTRIDGVEIDPASAGPHAQTVYSEILIGDVCEVLPRRAAEVGYDVILLADVIEELYKDDGRALLEVAARLAVGSVVVRLRLDDVWPGERAGPDRRRSCWSAADFAGRTFAGRACSLHEFKDSSALALIDR